MPESTRPSGEIYKLTPSSSLIPTGITRGLQCGTAGTFTGKDAKGNTITDFPLKEGTNPIQVSVWSGGTATDVWGLY